MGVLLAIVTALVLSACAPDPSDVPAAERTPAWESPPPDAGLDYQLGGAYDPAPGVAIVARDREARPAEGTYSICYVNGFQTQPGELDGWDADLLLRRDGEPVYDPEWPDEALLDTSTPDRRERIAETVTAWVDGCADAGFDAVEFDNLDSHTRSQGALDLADNLALAATLVDAAHAAGLAAGQKNAAEWAPRLRAEAGFDFAVAEECSAYDECSAYTAVYGDAVLDIEYTDQLPRSFAEMCAEAGAPASMVLRDRDLVSPGDEGYVFETCAG